MMTNAQVRERVSKYGRNGTKGVARFEPKALTKDQRAAVLEKHAGRDFKSLTQEERTEMCHAKLGYRYQVGDSDGFCFFVLGQGDSWEEAFEAADKALADSAARRAARNLNRYCDAQLKKMGKQG